MKLGTPGVREADGFARRMVKGKQVLHGGFHQAAPGVVELADLAHLRRAHIAIDNPFLDQWDLDLTTFSLYYLYLKGRPIVLRAIKQSAMHLHIDEVTL